MKGRLKKFLAILGLLSLLSGVAGALPLHPDAQDVVRLNQRALHEPQASQAASPQIAPFPRDAVRLTPGMWMDAEKRDGEYLLSLDPDRLLYAFRATAGLPAPGMTYGGWEEAKGELRGHLAGGHYLSALALMYSSTGDVRFKERGELMVRELGKCQAASGYLSAFPESFFDRVENGKPVWAPYYTVHKIFAGLLEQYELCGNADALEMAKKLAGYFEKRNGPFDAKKMSEVLKDETGGFVELLWNLYAITKDAKTRAFAEKFEKSNFIQPLMQSEDKLTDLHGNTHIPLVIGAMRRYELTGDTRYLDLAQYFWGRVVGPRTWATGGTAGPFEFWGEAGKLSDKMSYTTHESCKTYNLLRLARKLFEATGDYRYADYYNHAHLNGLLGTIGPEPGQFQYYTPMATGYHRWFSDPEKCMWCCCGSGMETFAKLGDSIFFHQDDTLIVNQFIPCVLDWKERKFKLALETKYPEEETVDFVVKSGSANLTLKILKPSWADKGVTVQVNDKTVPLHVKDGFIIVDNVWKAGDRISVRFPMSLRSIPLPDDANQVAIAYGPVVLAGILDRPKVPKLTTLSNMGPPDAGTENRAYYFVADSPNDLTWLNPVAGKPPLHFKSEGQPANIDFQPFYTVTGERYGIYWPIVANGSERQEKLARVNEVFDFLGTMKAWKTGDSLTGIEPTYAGYIADKDLAEYHKRLRLSMAGIYMALGQMNESLEAIQPLLYPFIGKSDAEKILAIVGVATDPSGVRPLLIDQIQPHPGDASDELDVVDGVPAVKTQNSSSRFVYFAFTPKARAELAGKTVRITMKYRSESAPVLHYSSKTNPYAGVRPAKIETLDGWQFATFECPAAGFSGAQNNKADMRVTAEDGATIAIADLKAEASGTGMPIHDK